MATHTEALSNFDAAIATARTADAAFKALQDLAQATVGSKLFTVMTVDMAADVARRAYTSDPENYPASGTKPINYGPWFDVVHNELPVAIVDASIEAHMLDHLIYGTTPAIAFPPPGAHRTLVAGRTCLAGDSFGDHSLDAPLAVGDEVRFADAAGYTMVKANWFNGVPRPSIVVRRLDGSIDVVREFSYEDFRSNLS